MAAPTYQALGTGAAGVGAISPAWPTHETGDVALLVCQSSNEVISLSTANGFVEIPDSPQGTGTAATAGSTRLAAFWCRATSNSMSAPTVADSGDHNAGIIITFRGCIASGDPWDVTAGDVLAAAATAFSIPGDTTTVDECLIVAMISHGTDTSSAQATGWTNASLVSITERADLSISFGTGGGAAIAEGVKSTAGAYSATTGSMATSTLQGLISIALKPPAVVAGTNVGWVGAGWW